MYFMHCLGISSLISCADLALYTLKALPNALAII